MTDNKPTQTPDFKSMLLQLDDFLSLYLIKKAPPLPDNVKEFIVKYSPYLTILLMLISLPAILFAFGLGWLLAPMSFMGGYRAGMSFSFGTLVMLVVVVLEIMAIPGLISRKATAWKLLFYSVLINSVYSLISFNLGNLILGTLISLYILYQVKSYYK